MILQAIVLGKVKLVTIILLLMEKSIEMLLGIIPKPKKRRTILKAWSPFGKEWRFLLKGAALGFFTSSEHQIWISFCQKTSVADLIYSTSAFFRSASYVICSSVSLFCSTPSLLYSMFWVRLLNEEQNILGSAQYLSATKQILLTFLRKSLKAE